MATQRSRRTGLIWAVIGGVVLVVGVVAIIVASITGQTLPSASSERSPDSETSAPSAGPDDDGLVVDPTAEARGWTPEPITTDPETYIRAALEAASTFDTTKSSRADWLNYVDTWFTPDTRYNAADRPARMKSAQVELRQGVVLPEEEWESLAAEDGRVVATVAGEVSFVPVAEDPSGDMSLGTADVVLTFTRSSEGGESSYEETVRVSVQVLCGPESVPTLQTGQRAGDCKVVRYFTEPLEP
ncbi:MULTISPECIES: hypothetical protein [unclassified Microbacterium]|uniref:hypothetical protein n=1 Tax=unclassified Microbacterium TaxID=2609290 RepID=UPI00214B663B|nr:MULTISPECIES: hypothetical protein [unclassified Microbacterium]MCR2811310.1 hypothetical protein [Microbacterium sp. zg.B185]WIM19467.1 hypothetical protein QNO12_01260 [Microbacterium sp. zg-B185]